MESRGVKWFLRGPFACRRPVENQVDPRHRVHVTFHIPAVQRSYPVLIVRQHPR